MAKRNLTQVSRPLNFWRLLAILAVVFCSEVFAADSVNKHRTTASAASKENPAVLDFEADIIEGERKNPQLFLQLGAETPDLNAVLYLRKDFNDFHDVEKRRKPRYQSRKQSGKK